MSLSLLHVIPSIEASAGGPSRAVLEMCRGLRAASENAEIVSTAREVSPSGAVGAGGGPLFMEDVPVRLFPRRGSLEYKYSPALAAWLKKEVRRYDVVHIHAVFNHSSHAAACAAASHGVPYVIRPVGTLNRSYALRQGHWRKRLYLRLIARKELDGAAAVHCTSPAEKTDVEALAIRAPAAVIPLGLQVEEFEHLPPRGTFRQAYAPSSEAPLVAFLGRIHPKKGFDLLLPALESLRPEHDFLLALAGPADRAYRASLEQEVLRRGLQGRTVWTGMLEGEARLALLADADLFVLPSYYENFGMAVAEAMACGVPVVVSDQVDLCQDIREYRAGLVTRCDAGELAGAVRRLLADKGLRAEFGENGRRLVRDRFTWNSIVPQLRSLYESVRSRQPS